jgi:hypothetical protein
LDYRQTDKPKLLKVTITKGEGRREKNKGYIRVYLYKDGKRKCYSVHRLVAITFIPNPLNLPMINHIDENKSNNSVDNLEWCTNRYNQIYSNGKKIACYDKNDNLIKIYECVNDACKDGFHSSSLLKCLKNKPHSYTCGGYKWRYITDE